MYGLHWIAVLAMLAVSWSRSGNVLHPHFIFTVMFCVHLSDFLTRGYDDQTIAYIPSRDLHRYQLQILLIIVATNFLSLSLRTRRVEAAVRGASEGMVVTKVMIRRIGAVAWLIVGAEILKRLNSVGWSPAEVLSQSFNPRFDREWDRDAFARGNFIYAIITILLPLSASAFAYIIVTGRGLARFVAPLGFLLVLAIQITDGFRTPVAVGLAALAIFVIHNKRNVLWKALILGALGVAGAAAMSVMYLFRSAGYYVGAAQGKFAFIYHQDDSYYRAIYAYYISDTSRYSWDPLYFIYLKLISPIPRFFWPDKPVIDEVFYGEYKLPYVTMLYIGDIVAMAGPLLTVFIAIVFGLAVYWMFYRSAALLRYPLGVAAYVMIAVYVYMILRSAENVAHWAYLPAFSVLVVLALRAVAGRRYRAPAASPTS